MVGMLVAGRPGRCAGRNFGDRATKPSHQAMPSFTRYTAFVLLLFIGPILIFPSATADETLTVQTEVTFTTNLRPHPSIVIAGDADFRRSDSGVIAGNGTTDDPYVIAGWHILHTGAAGIRLVGTDAHVVIRDIYLEGQEAEAVDATDCVAPPAYCDVAHGIGLMGATNVTVSNVRIIGETEGIRILGSAHVHVAAAAIGVDAGLPFRVVKGLTIADSANVSVAWSSYDTINEPLTIRRSHDILIAHSRFTGTGSNRATVSSADDVIFHGNSFAGLYFNFQAMEHVSFLHNVFRDNHKALSWGPAPGSGDHFRSIRLCGNTFEGMTGHAAVFLDRVDQIEAVGNLFRDNQQAAFLVATDVLLFEGNRLERSGDIGVVLDAVGANVHQNHFALDGGMVAVPRAGSDASGNWWGDASGPSGIAPGNGAPFSDAGVGVPYAPFLSAPPTPATDCQAPTVPGAMPAVFHVRAGAGATFGVEFLHLHAERDVRTPPTERPLP